VARAQAWLGDQGNLEASVNYDFTKSNDIVEEPNIKIGPEPILSHAVVVGLEYVPIEKLAISVALPLLVTKYQGIGELFPRHGEYDDGKLHYVLQDFLGAIRYQVLADPVTITPHVSVTIPVSDYETLGYANAGRHLKQLHLGAALGKYFGSLYAHAQYEFTLSEKFAATENTKKIGQNRSDLALTLGYLLMDGKLEFNAGANFRFAHGGIRFIDFNDLPMDIQDNHDPLLREEFILVGPGASYQVTDRFKLMALGRLWVYGRNTRNANSFGLGAVIDVM